MKRQKGKRRKRMNWSCPQRIAMRKLHFHQLEKIQEKRMEQHEIAKFCFVQKQID